jgi:hypothetical protein
MNQREYTWMTDLKNGNEKPGRSRCRWENIKMDLREIGCNCVNWIHLAQYD